MMKPNRIISLGLSILLLFMTVSCAESPSATSSTSDDITTTPTVTTTQKTTTTTQQNPTQGVLIPGNVRVDTFHLHAEERSAEKGWVNLNHLLTVNDEQKALFDGDLSTVYANWKAMLMFGGETVAFTKDVQLWAVEITFENQHHYLLAYYGMGDIDVVLGTNYCYNDLNPATVTYWGKKEVDGELMIELPTTLYWEARESNGSKPYPAGLQIMSMSGSNPSNPIVDIQFYGIVVENES